MQKRGDRGVTSIFSGTKVYNLRSDLKSQISFEITFKICYVTPLKYPQAATIRDQEEELLGQLTWDNTFL